MGVRPERKFFDTIRAANIPGTGGTIFSPSLNLIPQDATQSGRIGLKCTIVSIHLRLINFNTVAAVPAALADAHRVILYLDTQANGAPATPTQILTAPVDINAFNNLEFSGRFRIIMDKIITFGSTAGGVGPAQDGVSNYRLRKLNKKCRIPLRFSGATGAITELQSNNLGVLVIAAAAAANCLTAYTARIRYVDS